VASSGPAPTAPGLSCAEGSRAGCRTPGGVSPEQSRRNPLPHPAAHTVGDAAQGTVGLLGCQHTLVAHVQLDFSQGEMFGLAGPTHPTTLQALCVVVRESLVALTWT